MASHSAGAVNFDDPTLPTILANILEIEDALHVLD
jgi:hypothetical protein